MKSRLLLLFLSIFTLCVNAQVLKIRDARARDTGTVVTVRGIATNGSEIGQSIRYFQDSTGALSAFFSNSTQPTFANVKRGDSIEVTGVLKIFNGLLEIDPIQSFRIINSNNPVPTPLSITPAQLVEANESRLIRLNKGTFSSTATSFAGNANYNFVSDGVTVQVRVNTGSSLIGKLIPKDEISLVAIVSEFRSVYQILPRDTADLIFANIALTSNPTATNQTTTGFTVNWTTSIPGTTVINYGLTPALGQTASVAGTRNAHAVSLSGLTPATIYYVQVASTSNGVTTRSSVVPFITNSTSSGEMRVYFNRSVDTSVATPGNRALATTGGRCESELVSRILQAKTSVDVAMYSNSSTSIVGALRTVAQRGVRVRYIADRTALNLVLSDTANLGFKLLRKPTTELMHNKFFVIDANDAQNSWIVTGSMNNTTGQIYQDPNHMVMIQDQSLAKIYTVEFEEMWGSSTANFDATKSKFGPNKEDNTPKSVLVAGKPVEVYFSPTDKTSNAIINVVNSANNDLQLGLLIFTYFDLGTVVRNAQVRGVAVRGIVDNDTANASSQINFLQRNNVPIRLYPYPDIIFHHKYVIVDARAPNSDPTVATGSHNWTNAAETRNDENEIIIHDAGIANIFLQEFEARWKETIVSSTANVNIEGLDLTVSPNPASDFVQINVKNELSEQLNVMIFNSLGQIIEGYTLGNAKGETTKMIPLSNLPNGQYFVRVGFNEKYVTKSVQIAR